MTPSIPVDGIQACYVCGKEPVIERKDKQWFIHCPDCELSFLYSKEKRFIALLIWNECMKMETKQAASEIIFYAVTGY